MKFRTRSIRGSRKTMSFSQLVYPVCLACEAMLHPSPKNPPPVGPLRPRGSMASEATHHTPPDTECRPCACVVRRIKRRSGIPCNPDLTALATSRASCHCPMRNGVATSSSPFQSLLQGDEDIASPQPFPKGAASRCARPIQGNTAHQPYRNRCSNSRKPTVTLTFFPPRRIAM